MRATIQRDHKAGDVSEPKVEAPTEEEDIEEALGIKLLKVVARASSKSKAAMC